MTRTASKPEVSKQVVDDALMVMEERERCGLPGQRPLSPNEIMGLHNIAIDRLNEEKAEIRAEKAQLIADWGEDSDKAAAREAQLCRRINILHLIIFGAGCLLAYMVKM